QVDNKGVAQVLPHESERHHEQCPVRVLVELWRINADASQQVLNQTKIRVKNELESNTNGSTGNHKRGKHHGTHKVTAEKLLIQQHGQEQTEHHRSDHSTCREDDGV